MEVTTPFITIVGARLVIRPFDTFFLFVGLRLADKLTWNECNEQRYVLWEFSPSSNQDFMGASGRF